MRDRRLYGGKLLQADSLFEVACARFDDIGEKRMSVAQASLGRWLRIAPSRAPSASTRFEEPVSALTPLHVDEARGTGGDEIVRVPLMAQLPPDVLVAILGTPRAPPVPSGIAGAAVGGENISSKEDKMAHRTEELASKAAGAMKTAKAAFKGLTGVFKVLTREHGEASALLMRVKMSSDVRVRSELFPKIRAELMVHEKGELREVYPVFMQHPELENIAKDHQREAGELQSLLDGLSALPYDNAAWEQGFASLVELVGQHTKQEENEYFPLANRVLGHAEIERLQSQYETAKAEVMQKLSVGDGR